ncbi:uncharacterized protein LOC120210455 [Hibiscus syriacus]|uniref:uncharacterized protein LOC120210455 n=1 Tax=Hibiscus syriacus TaxID=106335 RepID=UPI0019205377|nr:uncharacterized protein LOC120210455 [Hibiscus syriacus]
MEGRQELEVSGNGLGEQIVGSARKEESSKIKVKSSRRWKLGFQVSKCMSIRSAQDGRRGCGRFARVYRRSRARRVWLCSGIVKENLCLEGSQNQKHNQSSGDMANCQQLSLRIRENGLGFFNNSSVPVQSTSVVPLVSSSVSPPKGTDSIIASCSRKDYRRKRRGLISEALGLAEISTVYSSTFNKLLEEALETWDVCQMLGILNTKVSVVVGKADRREDVKGCLGVSCSGVEGGLISLWNENVFNVSNHHVHSRFLALVGNFMHDPKEFIFINVYGPAIKDEKEDFFRELLNFVMSWNLPALLSKSISDHNPVLLEDVNLNWGPKPFRFFNFLLQEQGFDSFVEKLLAVEKNKINNGGIFRVLQAAKKQIRRWPGSSHLRLPDFISMLEAEIAGLETKSQGGILSKGEWDQLTECKKELWRLLRIEESIWCQKSRSRWIKNGDRNTRFFHLSALKRSRVNCIHTLNINGELVSDKEKIRGGVFNFFNSAYNSNSALEVKDLNFDFAQLTASQSAFLEAEFSELEVWQVISSSDSSKAPGPDGFSMGFFKKYWNFLKEQIMVFFSDFYMGKKWAHGVNHAFITLIPKKGNPEKIEDYRPISLVGSLYKILSKVLSKRLISCIKDIISPSQFAFIPGRQLWDCAFIANEGIDSWRKQGLKGVVFKVDFSRAYDIVEWQIIQRLMKELGFGKRWCSWIAQCISTASISVLVNGSPTEEFSIAKGLRQGCSLSPLLFNMVGELLHLMLNKAVDLGLFQGFSFGKNQNSFSLSHLQFADDLIIFCRASVTQIKNVRRVLRIFSVLTGLHLNLSKSKLFGINVGSDILDEWARNIGCSVGSFPTDYLGLPLGAVKNLEKLWDPVFANFNRKLTGWKASSLSMAGRLFLCSKHNVSCHSMDINKVFSQKDSWIWRGIVNNFFKNDDFGGCLRSHAKLQIGNGKSISFWNDSWLGEVPLKLLFPRIFVLSSNKLGHVADFGSFELSGWVWNVTTRRNLCDWEVMQLVELLDRLKDIKLIETMDDCMLWDGSDDGLFSVKACRQALSSFHDDSFQWNKCVWLGFVPPRVETFLWQLSHQKVAVRAELLRRGVNIGDNFLCPLCNLEEESVQHLFISCPVSWVMWTKLIGFWGVRLALPSNPPSLLSSWEVLRPNSVILQFIPGVVFWSIWKIRNEIIFDKGKLDIISLFFTVRFRLAKWFLAKFPLITLQVDSLIGDPTLADNLTAHKTGNNTVLSWIPPPVDFFKMNVDGAVSSVRRLAGIGGIPRDWNRVTLASFSEKVGPATPILAELKAIKRGIDLFLSSSWASKGRLIIESDSKTAVEWINDGISSPVFLANFVKDIVFFLGGFMMD